MFNEAIQVTDWQLHPGKGEESMEGRYADWQLHPDKGEESMEGRYADWQLHPDKGEESMEGRYAVQHGGVSRVQQRRGVSIKAADRLAIAAGCQLS